MNLVKRSHKRSYRFSHKIILLMALFLPLFMTAQEMITISGYMEDGENGEILLGGTIYDLNSKKGAVTNDYGFYSLTIPKDSVYLRITYTGFDTQYYKGQPNGDLKLTPRSINNWWISPFLLGH